MLGFVYLLLAGLVLSLTDVSATTHEPIVGRVEVCPGVFRVDTLIDNNFIDTYYEPFTPEAYECAVRLEAIEN